MKKSSYSRNVTRESPLMELKKRLTTPETISSDTHVLLYLRISENAIS